MIETQNATITGTMLGFEDHGIFTSSISLNFGGTTQGFGGYSLHHGNSAALFIEGVLNTLKLDAWEKLIGTNVRARRGATGRLEAIGHIIEDRWFELSSVESGR